MNSAELKVSTLAAVREQPSLTRAQRRSREALLASTAIAIALGIFFWAGGVRAAPRSTSLLLGTAGGELVIALGMINIGLRTRGPTLSHPPRHWALLLALVPATLCIWKVGYSLRDSILLAEWPGRVGFRCLGLALTMGAPLLLVPTLLRRGTEPLYAGTVGIKMGAAIGAVTWFFVDLWCPVAHPRHLLIGHVVPFLLLATLGGLLGHFVMTTPPKSL